MQKYYKELYLLYINSLRNKSCLQKGIQSWLWWFLCLGPFTAKYVTFINQFRDANNAHILTLFFIFIKPQQSLLLPEHSEVLCWHEWLVRNWEHYRITFNISLKHLSLCILWVTNLHFFTSQDKHVSQSLRQNLSIYPLTASSCSAFLSIALSTSAFLIPNLACVFSQKQKVCMSALVTEGWIPWIPTPSLSYSVFMNKSTSAVEL